MYTRGQWLLLKRFFLQSYLLIMAFESRHFILAINTKNETPSYILQLKLLQLLGQQPPAHSMISYRRWFRRPWWPDAESRWSKLGLWWRRWRRCCPNILRRSPSSWSTPWRRSLRDKRSWTRSCTRLRSWACHRRWWPWMANASYRTGHLGPQTCVQSTVWHLQRGKKVREGRGKRKWLQEIAEI